MGREAVEREFADAQGHVLAKSIFGHADPARALDAVDRLCRRELGWPPVDVLFFTMSVGAVFGLRLEDGREVALKVHLPRERLERLRSVQGAQLTLARNGFPCPRPVGAPAPFDGRAATFEELVGGGESRDAHDSSVRAAMASTLATLVRLASARPVPGEFGGGWQLVPDRSLWPTPHNALFDFERTTSGAEWIDRMATRARTQMAAPGRAVVCHSDWSVKHFRFHGLDVHTIYDWDSEKWDGFVVLPESSSQ